MKYVYTYVSNKQINAFVYSILTMEKAPANDISVMLSVGDVEGENVMLFFRISC